MNNPIIETDLAEKMTFKFQPQLHRHFPIRRSRNSITLIFSLPYTQKESQS